MSTRTSPGGGLTCQEVVELVTDYIEGVLDDATAARVDEHLSACPGCMEYVRQVRATIRLLGQVETPSLSERTRSDLMAAFRHFRTRRGGA